MAMYCFCHCFLYPRTDTYCSMGLCGNFYPAFHINMRYTYDHKINFVSLWKKIISLSGSQQDPHNIHTTPTKKRVWYRRVKLHEYSSVANKAFEQCGVDTNINALQTWSDASNFAYCGSQCKLTLLLWPICYQSHQPELELTLSLYALLVCHRHCQLGQHFCHRGCAVRAQVKPFRCCSLYHDSSGFQQCLLYNHRCTFHCLIQPLSQKNQKTWPSYAKWRTYLNEQQCENAKHVHIRIQMLAPLS